MKAFLKTVPTRTKIALKSALHWFSVQGKLYIKGLPSLFFVVVLIAPCVLITGKYIEAVMQIVALLFLRYKFDKTFHAKKTLICTFITLSVAYIAIPSVVNVSSNLFSGILVSFAIAFASWLAQEFVDRGKIIADFQEKKEPEFRPELCTPDELSARCRLKKIRQDRIEYVCDLFLSTMSNKELADKYFVERTTILQDRWRFRNRLK